MARGTTLMTIFISLRKPISTTHKRERITKESIIAIINSTAFLQKTKKVAEQLDLSKREAASNVHNSSGVGSHLQRLCEDQGVEVEDFWSTAIMRRAQSCPIMSCLQQMNVNGTSRNHADNVLNDTVYEIIRKEFNRTNRIPISPEVSNDCKFEF